MANDTDERNEFSDAELDRLYAVYNGRDADGGAAGIGVQARGRLRSLSGPPRRGTVPAVVEQGTGPSADWIKQITESAGGAFRFGTGVMGKSAVLLCVLLVVIGIAAFKLTPTAAILAVVCIGVASFFGWLIAILRYTANHPESALLEGAEWTSWKRFEATAKGLGVPPAAPAISDPAAPAPRITAKSEDPD